MAAGFGNMLARPLFREKHSPDMSEADAEALLHEALKVSILLIGCLHACVPARLLVESCWGSQVSTVCQQCSDWK